MTSWSGSAHRSRGPVDCSGSPSTWRRSNMPRGRAAVQVRRDRAALDDRLWHALVRDRLHARAGKCAPAADMVGVALRQHDRAHVERTSDRLLEALPVARRPGSAVPVLITRSPSSEVDQVGVGVATREPDVIVDLLGGPCGQPGGRVGHAVRDVRCRKR